MLRTIAVIAIAIALAGALPAVAQEIPELEGGPGSQAAEHAAAQKRAEQKTAELKAAADSLKSDQTRLAREADAQKAEQSRLARLAEDLKAREARLDTRAAELDAQEQRLTQLGQQQEAARGTQLADLERRRDTPPPLNASSGSTDADSTGVPDIDADATPPSRDLPPRTTPFARLDFDAALRECTRAGEDAAWARRFDAASYAGEPRVYNDEGWELRGRMRLEDRRGYRMVDTVCEVDSHGEVQHFALLR